jgi:hypothetical protein
MPPRNAAKPAVRIRRLKVSVTSVIDHPKVSESGRR